MSSKGLCRSLFLVLFLSLASAFGDGNLLVNPGFEDGTDGWAGRGCVIEAVTSPVHGGSGSARAYGRSDTWQGIRQSMVGKMTNGETYRVSGWVRLENSSSDIVTVSFEQQDDDGTNYYNVASATATDGEWVELSGDFTLNVEGELYVLDVYFEGPAAEVDFFVDDASVYGPGAAAAEPAAEAVETEPKATAQIDVSTRYQEIEGIGASGAHYTMEFVRHQKKSELYNLLFKELGLDIFRIRNNYDTEPNSFMETVEIVKGAKAAVGGDLKIMISSWSPPASLKSNDSMIGGTLKKKDGKYVYDEFAQWWCDSLAAYEKAGVKADYVNIQNEPDSLVNWDSCQLEPTETSELAGYDAAFEAVWQKLNKEMGSAGMPKMLAPETTGLDRIEEYIDELDEKSHVYGYAHHLYNCSGDGDNIPGCGAAPDRYLSRMAEVKSKYGSSKPLMQTEYEHQPGPWEDAMNTAVLMHNALSAEGVSAYLYWDLFWGSRSGLVSIDDPCSITIKPTYYTFKQYSAFIDSGWQRVEASSDNSNLRISAYIGPDDKKLTVVLINTTASTEIALDCSVRGFTVSKGEVYRTSETENCAHIGSYSGGEPLTLPANSVTTLALRAK